jgi:hypothetical protein
MGDSLICFSKIEGLIYNLLLKIIIRIINEILWATIYWFS